MLHQKVDVDFTRESRVELREVFRRRVHLLQITKHVTLVVKVLDLLFLRNLLHLNHLHRVTVVISQRQDGPDAIASSHRISLLLDETKLLAYSKRIHRR